MIRTLNPTPTPCAACGRPLRSPASRRLGLGPVCARQIFPPAVPFRRELAPTPGQLTIPIRPWLPQAWRGQYVTDVPTGDLL